MENYEALRPQLFGIAYRMLGTVAEAEDILQEAYLRFERADQAEIRSPEAFLKTIVTRLCLDTLKSARVQREVYIGEWLPEPLLNHGVIDPAEEVARHDSLSMAFLVLLESLSPEERAVFLLREVFDYAYEEIALIVGKSVVTCRQLLSRAKKHVIEKRPRFELDNEEHNHLLHEFIVAVQTGEINGLMAVLADDVTLWSDGGGKVTAINRPLTGAKAVAKLFLYGARQVQDNIKLEVVRINDRMGLLIYNLEGQVIQSVSFEVEDHKIQAIYATLNPDKLRHLNN